MPVSEGTSEEVEELEQDGVPGMLGRGRVPVGGVDLICRFRPLGGPDGRWRKGRSGGDGGVVVARPMSLYLPPVALARPKGPGLLPTTA